MKRALLAVAVLLPSSVAFVACGSSGNAQATCSSQVKPLQDSLTSLDAHLSVGMQYGPYTQAVGDAAVPAESLGAGSGACAKVIGDLMGAFGAYKSALTAWQACMNTSGCSISDDEADTLGLQHNWTSASAALKTAAADLAAIK